LDPAHFIKELGDLGAVTSVTLDPSRLPALAEMDPEQCYLGWTIEMDTAKDLKVIEAVFDFGQHPDHCGYASSYPRDP
jgi:two-component system chemotaxis sensor kinase CheA